MERASLRHENGTTAVREFLGGSSPRASGFIVTLYGDVAAPRGGTLWMGTLIESCAAQGISESLVRTAVSRLVENGRLVGDRIGRKSYYRLTKPAEKEFSGAAELLYSPPPPPERFLLALGARDLPEGWARIGPEAALSPEGTQKPSNCAVFTANDLVGVEHLPDFVGRFWPLDAVETAYRDFVETFSPLEAALEEGGALDGATALALRLRLVHHFRAAALADPRLPAVALPKGWPAGAARLLFVSLYLKVSASADRHIGLAFQNSDGFLPERTETTAFRLEALHGEVARQDEGD
ncbi:PaaX family transcriptional regulator C-terminal domain-containing protein [Martelella radicis]|uniref:Phenylacetic acid degradation operon negative regulatory protein n=1 Tax=Martelella radicis TaxID=1397476 RepID=A0A7W6KK06_9HYPH|nr:PaaX family transcriptional regulator C-terminal domain-containing protein [Martelella radicis]MBB4122733.1 phenylacetic acid degradation operon negative regulatory protein [Martelella radicis]